MPGTRRFVPTVLPLAALSLFAAFAGWMLFAILGVRIRQSLGLEALPFGILMGMPMLLAALGALPVGLLSERSGSRRIIMACLALLMPFLVWLGRAQSYTDYLIAGCGLGLTGGLYCAGLHYVVRHSRPGREGLALGLYGAGMAGVAVNVLVVPFTERAFGWHLAPLVNAALVLFALFLLFLFGEADDDQARAGPDSRHSAAPAITRLLQLGADRRFRRLCLAYSWVFGSYLALAFWLPDYIGTQFLLPLPEAARLSLFFTLPGALGMVAGGWMADRAHTPRNHSGVLWICLICLFVLSYPPTAMEVASLHGPINLTLIMPLPAFLAILTLLALAMGFVHGGVLRWSFHYVPESPGLIAGALTSAGGISAFVLPLLFGLANAMVGIRSTAFMILFGFLVLCMTAIHWSASTPVHPAANDL